MRYNGFANSGALSRGRLFYGTNHIRERFHHEEMDCVFLALLICLLPVSAVAASPCDNGHTVGSTLHAPTYVDCTGGFKSTL